MATARRDNPLSMRLPKQDIELIDRAAALRSRSRTEFVRESAVRAAEEVLLEATPVRMSPTGFARFEAAITGKPVAVPAMVKLLKRRAPWEK